MKPHLLMSLSLLPCFKQPHPCSLFLLFTSTQGCSVCTAFTAVGFFPSLVFTNSPSHRYSLTETQLGLAKRGAASASLRERPAATPVGSNFLAYVLLRCNTCSLSSWEPSCGDVLLNIYCALKDMILWCFTVLHLVEVVTSAVPTFQPVALHL